LFRVIGSVGMLVLAAAAFLAWRLERGPLPLDALTPHIEAALNRAGLPLRARVGGTEVAWAGLERALDVRATNVTLETEDGRIVSNVPEIALSVAPKPLLKGEVVIRSLEILRPTLMVVRLPDGTVSLGGEPLALDLPTEGAPRLAEGPRPLDWVEGATRAEAMAVVDPVAVLDWLSDMLSRQGAGMGGEVLLTDASLTLEDMIHGGRLEFPKVNARLSSDGALLTLGLGAHLALPDSRPRFNLVLRHGHGAAEAEAELAFSGLDPRQLATVVPDMTDTGMVDASLSGTATARLDLVALTGADPRQGLEALTFGIQARDAYLTLPAGAQTTYHMATVTLEGAVEAGLSAAVLHRLDVDLGDALIRGDARITDPLGKPSLALNASLVSLHVEDLKRYWPRDVADGARVWIAENLSEGTIQQADFHLDFAGPSLEDLDITTLRGYALIDGMTVDYRAPLPPLERVVGEVSFGLDSIDIDVAGGRIQGHDDLEVVTGTVSFLGFADPIQRADIDVLAAGSLSSVLSVIDHDPLNYARAVGIDPTKAQGLARANLSFDFPLLKDLTFDEVDVAVEGDVKDAGLEKIVFGHDLDKGQLTLSLTKDGMDVAGTARVARVPASLAWRENFSGGAFQSRYRVQATLDDAQRATFGLDIPPFQPPHMTGPARASLVYTSLGGGKSELEADLDLSQVAMALDVMDWSKPTGTPAKARVRGHFSRSDAVLDFSVDAAPRLRAEGMARLDPDTGAANRVTVSNLALDRSWLKGEVLFGGPRGIEARVDDGVLDLRPLLKRREAEREARGAAGAPATGEDDPLPALVLDLALRELWLGDTTVLERVNGHVERDDTLWRRAVVDAGLRGGPPLAYRLNPALEQGKGREFSLTAGDAGALLRALGVVETIDGGALVVDGTLNDAGVARGSAVITSFRLKDAPVLAQILSFAGFTGILDVLGGNGISFTEFNLPFVHEDSTLRFKEARAYGNAIGLTASGSLNLDAMTVDMNGTIVPAYAINSLLGHIPVLGEIILGGKGQGLFGVNYSVSGSLDDPRIMVNPLSALTPGFLRGIFGIFDRPEQTATEKVRGGGG
jgi:hypothetical protein